MFRIYQDFFHTHPLAFSLPLTLCGHPWSLHLHTHLLLSHTSSGFQPAPHLMWSSVIAASTHTSASFTHILWLSSCSSPYVAIRDRCIYVRDDFSGLWYEMRNLCHQSGGELLVMDSADLMADVIDHIRGNGERRNGGETESWCVR